MALRKEWLLPLARVVVQHGMKGPAFSLGDQVTYFTYDYATSKLRARGLLLNPTPPLFPSHENPRFVSARTVMHMLGVAEYYDIDLNGRAALTIDFSKELPRSLWHSAGLILDVGTTEHIFDIAHVYTNIVNMLGRGGFVLHYAPVSWFNHGFVNFNPLFFREFYERNHFDVLEHSLVFAPFHGIARFFRSVLGLKSAGESSGTPIAFQISDDRYFFDLLTEYVGIPAQCTLLFAAKKTADSESVTFPVQGMYRPAISKSIGAHG